MNRRSRDVAHAWYDKQIVRWFRKNFPPNTYRNIKGVYLSLCEMDSDFRGNKISGLNKTIMKYAGVSERVLYPTILFLEQFQLLKIKQDNSGSFGKSTFVLYEWKGQNTLYTDNKQYFDDILSKKINRSAVRTLQKSCTTNVDAIRIQVSINKNDKSSNIVSNETNTFDKVPRKIVKKKVAKSVTEELPDMIIDPHGTNSKPKAKYKYTKADTQLYNRLVELGATDHQDRLFKPTGEVIPSKAFYKTMDKIHELLNPQEYKPPFATSRNVPADYKAKEWTDDEIISTFEYYMNLVEDKAHYKNAGDFIYSNTYGTRSWSPLVKFHHDKERDNGNSLEGDSKLLMKFLRSQGYDETEITGSMVEKIIKLLDVNSKGYRIAQQLSHLYNGNIMYAFTEYIKRQMNSTTFRPHYMVGEKFVRKFISESKRNRVIVKGMKHAFN